MTNTTERFRIIQNVAVFVLIVFAAALMTLYLTQRQKMYFPDKSVSDPSRSGIPGITAVSVRTGDWLDITDWFKPPESPDKPTVVMFHGNADSIAGMTSRARPLAAAGYGVMLVEYRGYGGNPGQPTETGLYADATAALKWLRDVHGITGDKVVLYGHSLGSGVAVHMALENQVGGLVLEAPFTSIADVVGYHYHIPFARFLVWDKFDNLSKIGKVGAPILIMHGDADTIVPVEEGHRLFDAAPAPKEGFFIEGAGHMDVADMGGMETVLKFLDGLKKETGK